MESKFVLNTYKALLNKGYVNGPTDFCKKIGFHKVSWAKVEAGERNMPDEYIDAICQNFNIRRQYLLNGKGFIFEGREEKIKASNIKISETEKKTTVIFTDELGIKNIVTYLKNT